MELTKGTAPDEKNGERPHAGAVHHETITLFRMTLSFLGPVHR